MAPADLFIQLFSKSQNSFWLDREHNFDNRFSVIGSGLPAAGLDDLQRLPSIEDLDLPFDFRPGLVGAVGFEQQNLLLKVDRAIVFDHGNRKMHFIANLPAESEFELWYRAAFLRLALVGGEAAGYRLANEIAPVTTVRARNSKEQYLEMISKAQQRIAAGDVYQLCLTNQVSISSRSDPLATFLRLRDRVPTPYSTFLKIGETAVASASPEQFLVISPNGEISTKPIKGTRPRSGDSREDLEIAAELAGNAKERAENLMIVDLMRNDLGRVAELNSVQVAELFKVETYSTVHQLVSRVTAKLARDKTPIDAFYATFPGGSMTGAPKLSAISIIESLELGQRGIYSGAIGAFGINGWVELGMVIRTLVFEGDQISLGVGGGITIDSDPLAEFEEIQLKANALLEVLGAASPW